MSHPVIFLVALLGSCHYSTAELCTKSRANPCTIDQMRNNLLCRLTGGTTLDVTSLSDADKTNAVRSYLKYILEMVPNTVEIAAKRIEAMVSKQIQAKECDSNLRIYVCYIGYNLPGSQQLRTSQLRKIE
jgi:chromosomal replication initiation ATPase DnaA